jgi:predicted Rossmann-fold nucleotide-binding protein
VVFPGGFGTLDELFELLTLMQTQKIENKVILVLYGTKYWRRVVNFEALAEYGTIAPEDLRLFHEADDPQSALRILQEGLTKYYLVPEAAAPESEPATPDLARTRI